MRILVIGGAGFQGSHLTKRLVADGHMVTVLNTWSERAMTNLAPVADKIKIVWGSITDQEIVSKTVRDHDVVFHLAAYINVDESLENPRRTIEVNVLGSNNVLDAVRHNGNRLIYASSCEVYGDGHGTDEPLPESAELRPNSPYAGSKAAGDRLCHAYIRSYDIDATIVRPSNIFGEYQKAARGALIPRLVQFAMTEKPLTVFGDGSQERDYLYISDLVDAYKMVLETPEIRGTVINFGTGQSTKIIDIVNYIAQKFNAQVIHEPARPGEVSRFLLDVSKARSYGWEPQVTMWEGLDRYIDWARENSHIIK